MPFEVSPNRALPNAERTKQKQTIENNSLEWYARYADKVSAQRHADKVKKLTGVELAVTEYWTSSIRL